MNLMKYSQNQSLCEIWLTQLMTKKLSNIEFWNNPKHLTLL